jgi:plasmid stabilization system protein ParE
MNVVFRSDADDDVDAAVEYYAARSMELGNRFLDEVIAAVDRISANPEGWMRYKKKSRLCMMRVFPFGLIYRVEREVAVVYAVADMRRSQRRWTKRLP